MLRGLIICLLILLLTACNNTSIGPNTDLVQKAITFGLQQTQDQLSQKLSLDTQGFNINHLHISQKRLFKLDNLPTYKLSGTYDLTFKLPERQITQAQKSFDVYLQLQKEGKTWRLLVPELEENHNQTTTNWYSYLISEF